MISLIFMPLVAILLPHCLRGGFLQLQQTRQLGNTAKFVTKLDPVGDIVNSTAQASFKTVSTSGSIITVGSLETSSDSLNSMARSTSLDGLQMGAATIGGGGSIEELTDIIPRPQGGYQAIGCSNAEDAGNMQMSLTHFNENAEIQSSILFGTNETDAGIVMTSSRNGGTIIGGTSNKQIYNSSNQSFDSVVVKLNDQNQVVSAQQIGTSADDRVRDVDEDTNGNIITINLVATEPASNFISRFDSSLSHQWSKTVNIDGYDAVDLESLYALQNEEYMVSGQAYKSNDYDGFLGKLDSSGNFVWGRTYNEIVGQWDMITAINPTTLGDILIGGFTKNKYLLLGKTDSNGNLLWAKTWEDWRYPRVTAIYEMDDGFIHMVGFFCNQFFCSIKTAFIAMFDAEGNGPDDSFRTSATISPQVTDVTSQIQVTDASVNLQAWVSISSSTFQFPSQSIRFTPTVDPPTTQTNGGNNSWNWTVPFIIIILVALAIAGIVLLICCCLKRRTKASSNMIKPDQGKQGRLGRNYHENSIIPLNYPDSLQQGTKVKFNSQDFTESKASGSSNKQENSPPQNVIMSQEEDEENKEKKEQN